MKEILFENVTGAATRPREQIVSDLFVLLEGGYLRIDDGKTGLVIPENRLAVGCNTGTREAAALGFRLSDRWSLVTTLEHFSTVGCSDKPGTGNRGPANIGARLGYTF